MLYLPKWISTKTNQISSNSAELSIKRGRERQRQTEKERDSYCGHLSKEYYLVFWSAAQVFFELVTYLAQLDEKRSSSFLFFLQYCIVDCGLSPFSFFFFFCRLVRLISRVSSTLPLLLVVFFWPFDHIWFFLLFSGVFSVTQSAL